MSNQFPVLYQKLLSELQTIKISLVRNNGAIHYFNERNNNEFWKKKYYNGKNYSSYILSTYLDYIDNLPIYDDNLITEHYNQFQTVLNKLIEAEKVIWKFAPKGFSNLGLNKQYPNFNLMQFLFEVTDILFAPQIERNFLLYASRNYTNKIENDAEILNVLLNEILTNVDIAKRIISKLKPIIDSTPSKEKNTPIKWTYRKIALLCHYNDIIVTDSKAKNIVKNYKINTSATSYKQLANHYRKLNTPNQRTAKNLITHHDIKEIIPYIKSEKKEMAENELKKAIKNQKRKKR